MCIRDSHEGGHLPFEFEIGSHVKPENNLLIVRVDGNLAKDRVPPVNSNLITADYPPANFDFFPFCGIHRPVLLYTIPHESIKDITVNTFIEDNDGAVQVKLGIDIEKSIDVNISINGHGVNLTKKERFDDSNGAMTLKVSNATLWSTQSPNLYDLIVELSRNDIILDSYSLHFGIRTIKIENNELLLNGKPIFLKGFGKHEDFPILGRGFTPAVIIKDYSLMEWIGANSFRTSHYPYSEKMMDLADRLGILVIDEIPAVGLTFHKEIIDKHLELCQQYIEELIARDKNHPSVIMWSVANEPQKNREAKEFFRKLYEKAKKLDPYRIITYVAAQLGEERSLRGFDIVCVNRYYSWYVNKGKIRDSCEIMSNELDKLHKKYGKPIIITEFGAGAIPGWHAEPPEMWSEEYQVDFLKNYINVLESKPYIVGYHIWCMCDFKTGQSDARVGAMNYKGVFTRDRRPKMAAHMLRELWKEKK